MQQATFDRLARGLAARSSRRWLLGTAGGAVALGAAGGAVGFGLGASGRISQRATPVASPTSAEDELKIALLEAVAAIGHNHLGSCADLAARARTFQVQHQAELTRYWAEEQTWTRERRATFADHYGERMRLAAMEVQTALLRCQFHDLGMTAATPAAATPAASPAASVAMVDGVRLLSAAGEGASRLPVAQGTVAQSTISATATSQSTVPVPSTTARTTPVRETASVPATVPAQGTALGPARAPVPQLAAAQGVCNASSPYMLMICYSTSPPYAAASPVFAGPVSCAGPGQTNCAPCPGIGSEYCQTHYGGCSGGPTACQAVLQGTPYTPMTPTPTPPPTSPPLTPTPPPSGACTVGAPVVCMTAAYQGQAGKQWQSPGFTGTATCTTEPPTNDTCTVCGDNAYCARNYPNDCVYNPSTMPPSSLYQAGDNMCSLATNFYVPPPPTCCQKNCPVGPVGCSLSYLEGLFGGATCAECLMAWCGSTSWCDLHCEDADCCDEACNEAPIPPPPGGP